MPPRPVDPTSVAQLIARAFALLPASRWLVPDPAERVALLARSFVPVIEQALRTGRVDLEPAPAHRTAPLAAAVWLAGASPDPDGTTPDPIGAPLAEPIGPEARFRLLDELFERHAPSDVGPHDHLALVGVEPSAQGGGRGRRLLEEHHARLDAAGRAAYLEASSEGSRRLYLSLGYRDRGAPFALPDGSAFQPMWRDPR